MKNILKITFICSTLIGFMNSCTDILEENNNSSKLLSDGTVINGRFFFNSKESLSSKIKELKEMDILKLENKFENLYDKGFRSHLPIVNSENERLVEMFSKERTLKKLKKTKYNSRENFEDVEDNFILDPLFAALINSNNEIIVGDSIYKFTKDRGLFFAHLNDSLDLFNYVESEEVYETITAEGYELCELRTHYGGITVINDEISRYIAPIEEVCNSSIENFNYGSVPSYSQTTAEEILQQQINSLSICSGKDNWIQNIFGKSYYCTDYFDSQRRIKTEFWDQKWLIYASVGILAKTQVRRLGIWWASDSDEIHIGINRILLKYNYPEPEIKSITHPTLLNNTYKAPIYMYNGSFIVKESYGNYFANTSISVTKNNLPFFNFGNGQILNIYIPNMPLLGDINLNLHTQDITSESNVKALYKMGIDFLKDKFISGAKKEFAVSYQKNANEIVVLYFGERYKKFNNNKIEHRFYSDVNFIINASWSESSNNWAYSLKPVNELFRNYTHYELDFYGLARRSATWKGNRMIR